MESGTELWAGVATEDITPPPGVRLSGFAGRNPANAGARDPLHASALFLKQGASATVLIALDVIGLTPRDDARLRSAVAARLGIPANAVIAACSHTHSGPATMHIRATGAREPLWTREVIARSVRAAVRAYGATEPVTAVRLGSSPCAAGVHRRERAPDGTVQMGADPTGPIDPACRVLLLEGKAGRRLATLFQYGMHPVSLGRDNRLASADWVGVARCRIETTLGCPVLFVQGCCGDINPAPVTDGVSARDDGSSDTESLGQTVACAALAAVKDAPALLSSVRLGWGATLVRLPMDPLCPDEVLEHAEQSARTALLPPDISPTDRHLATAELEWLRACRRLRTHHPAGRVTALCRTHAVSLGPDFTLIGLPGEPFSQIGLRIREEVPGAWPVGYAAGNPGYLYPDLERVAGGYEVETAYRLYGEQPFGPGAADALIVAAVGAAQKARLDQPSATSERQRRQNAA